MHRRWKMRRIFQQIENHGRKKKATDELLMPIVKTQKKSTSETI
jgi:hypothetical protein